MNSIETGHSANIFCTKFVPETSDELIVSGAGDAEVLLGLEFVFNIVFVLMTMHVILG